MGLADALVFDQDIEDALFEKSLERVNVLLCVVEQPGEIAFSIETAIGANSVQMDVGVEAVAEQLWCEDDAAADIITAEAGAIEILCGTSSGAAELSEALGVVVKILAQSFGQDEHQLAMIDRIYQ